MPDGQPQGEQSGFILFFTILMLLGISTLAIGMVYNAHQGQVTAQNYKNRMRAFYAADGLRALLAQEILNGNAKEYIDNSLTGEIVGEVWNGAGASIDALKSAMAGRKADKTMKSIYLGSNLKRVSNYGVRWSGYIIPPATGSYTFFLRADDQGEFYLSKDESPIASDAKPIAEVSNWAYSWPQDGTGVSKPVSLKIGKKYYFELLHTQLGGEGFGQVGWSGPSYMVERPIPGKRLTSLVKKDKWDTTKVGEGSVMYTMSEIGPLVYTLNTEAMMGGKGDTTFRAPLNQTLSLRGDNPAPPETLWQHVIYYDYHSNGSNPDFQRGVAGWISKNMVKADQLTQTPVDAEWFGLRDHRQAQAGHRREVQLRSGILVQPLAAGFPAHLQLRRRPRRLLDLTHARERHRIQEHRNQGLPPIHPAQGSGRQCLPIQKRPHRQRGRFHALGREGVRRGRPSRRNGKTAQLLVLHGNPYPVRAHFGHDFRIHRR